MTDDTPGEFVLTRALLLEGRIAEMASRAVPDMRLLTDAERAESLAATLAARSGGGGAWLFAYGSLIWNPTIHFTERRVAAVQGWRRAFCLSVRAGRGSHDNPGLVLGLDRGGSCAGAAFWIAADMLEAELSLLWRREMLSGAYVPRWLDIFDAGATEPFGQAIAFTIDPAGPQYAGELAEAEVVRRLATATGPLGSAADYLFRTRAGLHSLGIPDPELDRLADAVAAAQAIDPP